MDSASVGFSLILRASSFRNSYDAVLAVIYLGILSIFFFPPLRGGLGWGCFPPLGGGLGWGCFPPLRGGLGWGCLSSFCHSQFGAP